MISLLCLGSSYYYVFLAGFGGGERVGYADAPVFTYIFETIFLIDMILSFFVEYIPERED